MLDVGNGGVRWDRLRTVRTAMDVGYGCGLSGGLSGTKNNGNERNGTKG